MKHFADRANLLSGLLLLAVTSAGAESSSPSDTQVDTQQWRCRFCPYPEGLKGTLDAGLGGASDQTVKLNAHNGLDEQRVFAIGAADLTWFGADAYRWDLQARDLGLQTRSVDLSGGQQGRYQIQFGYDESLHRLSDSARTPFLEPNHGTLTLPGDWVRASTTGGMTQLGNHLRSVDIATERQKISLAAKLAATSRWSFHWGAQHEEKTGNKVTGANFIVSAAQLLEPVDYQTDRLSAGMRYLADDWQLGLDYEGAFFTNQQTTLTWDNPYSSLAPGDDRGQLALPADNQFHQLNLQGFYRFTPRAMLSGNIAIGRMTQNDGFAATSVNPSLNQALQQNDANAEVNTLSANARLTWTPQVRGLSYLLRYRAEIHDNDTPSETFAQVITDTFAGASARNRPLSYGRHTLEGRVNYQLTPGNRLSGGLTYVTYERNNAFPSAQDLSTQEYIAQTELRSNLSAQTQLQIKAGRSWREGNHQTPDVANGLPQNPALIWFDVADRVQDSLRASLSFSPWDWLTASLSSQLKLSDFEDSVLGRTSRTQRSSGIDFSMTPQENVSLYAYFARQFESFDQNNSQGLNTANWRGKTQDTFNTFGLGGRVSGLQNQLGLSADVTFSDARGQLLVDTGTATPGFPDINHQRLTFRLGADYQITPQASLVLALAFENLLAQEDWHLDGVAPDTVPRLLSLGQDSNDQSVLSGGLRLRYRF